MKLHSRIALTALTGAVLSLALLVIGPALGQAISAMVAGSAVSSADLFESVQSGNTRKVTAAQIKTFTSASPTITGHPVIEGITSTGATGSGNLAFSISPSFTGTVGAAAITATGVITDSKCDVRNICQNKQNAAYTFAATDCGGHVYHDEATTVRTYTINSNANLALARDCAITIVNGHGTGVITLAITTDTLYLSGAGTTGSRSIAADCVVTILKVDTTKWYASGGSCLT